MASSQKKKKKQRCFAQDKFEHKFLKRADRWNGLGFSKQQQVYRDRNITVTAKEQTLVAQQQQLDADRQQLSSEEARLQATARQKFREADAAKLHAQRTTVWANNLVRTELGGNKLSRALSLEARLVDTGYVDLPAARRAVAQKIAQEAVIDKSRSTCSQEARPFGTLIAKGALALRPSPKCITMSRLLTMPFLSMGLLPRVHKPARERLTQRAWPLRMATIQLGEASSRLSAPLQRWYPR